MWGIIGNILLIHTLNQVHRVNCCGLTSGYRLTLVKLLARRLAGGAAPVVPSESPDPTDDLRKRPRRPARSSPSRGSRGRTTPISPHPIYYNFFFYIDIYNTKWQNTGTIRLLITALLYNNKKEQIRYIQFKTDTARSRQPTEGFNTKTI